MIRKFALLCLVICLQLEAQEPDWVGQGGKSVKYPLSEYVTGFGTSPSKEKDAALIAQDNARAQLSQSIIVNIRSEVIDKLEATGNKTSQYFSTVTQSSTTLQIAGVKTETYTKGKNTYAFAYVSKKELSRYYKQRRNDLILQVQKLSSAAEADEKAGRIDDAAKRYAGLFPLLEQLREATTILLVAQSGSEAESLLNEDRTIAGKEELAIKIDRLLARSISSVDDAARAVAYQIAQQITGVGKTMITPLTYQDSKMTSSFARYFRDALESQMQKFAVWDVARQTREFIPKSSQITRDLAVASGAQAIFEGNYWEQGDKIKIIGRLREVESGQIMASAEALFDKNLLNSRGLSSKPENYQKALVDQKAFAEEEIISGDIQLDVWTNKGNENLLFSEGEILKIYVRVNRAAHLRVIYNMADGSRVLLVNDYYLDESKVNQVVEIPGEFECAEPFGAETMLAFARTQEFPKIPTVVQDGYEFLVDTNAKTVGPTARGFKKKDAATQPLQMTESRLTITTMAK